MNDLSVSSAGGAVLLALLVDRLFGEPRRWHPVAGMGRYLGWIGKRIAPEGDGGGRDGALRGGEWDGELVSAAGECAGGDYSGDAAAGVIVDAGRMEK